MVTRRLPRAPSTRLVSDLHADARVWRGAPALGLVAAGVLMTAALVVPRATGWDVHAGFGPLTAHWRPRIGGGSIVAIPLAIGGVACAAALSQRLSWQRLLVVTWLATTAWVLSLALVDGRAGLHTRFDTDDLLTTARHTSNVSAMLHSFVSHIPTDAAGSWPVHVAGHPPGALLIFVVFARLGLSSLLVGLVVALLGATAPVGVLVTLRILGAEPAARAAAPFLVFAPAAIWEAVSADAIFACVAAWALTCLALAAVRGSVAWSLAAGLLLGGCVMMSYGLPLLTLLAAGILLAARSLRPAPWVVAAAVMVVVAFGLAGFSLIDAYPALRQRYWDGIAADRPASYWLWGDLAALCFSAGPVLGAAVACGIGKARGVKSAWANVSDAQTRVTVLLGGAALASVLAADVTLMSKAEVERIWLPFVPWLLVLCALLPSRWRRPLLVVQIVVALLVQHLLATAW